MSAQTYPTRTDANRANSMHSTGPRTEAGKAAVSTNATKHGLTANLLEHRADAVEPRRSSVVRTEQERLDPRDSPAYQSALADLTTGLAPANPTEELLIRDLAMLKARLERIEAAEYATLMFTLDGVPQCPDSMAAAYLTSAPQLTALEKTERFLRRNYMQTWSRLERLQRDRKKQERELAENQPVESSAPTPTKTPKQSHQIPTQTKQDPNLPPIATPAPQPATTPSVGRETPATGA